MTIREKLHSIPALWQGFWAYQVLPDGKIIVQQYIKSGHKRREFFGHTFLVDFETETLTPMIA